MDRKGETFHRHRRPLVSSNPSFPRLYPGDPIISFPLMSSPVSSATKTCSSHPKPVYWLSFRIASDVKTERPFHRRYDDLIKVISRHVSGEYWEESSSFIVFESLSTIDQIARDAKIAVDPRYDLFLIRRLDVKQSRICGRGNEFVVEAITITSIN